MYIPPVADASGHKCHVFCCVNSTNGACDHRKLPTSPGA